MDINALIDLVNELEFRIGVLENRLEQREAADREGANKWYAEHTRCPNCQQPVATEANPAIPPSVPFCDSRTRAWCMFCDWRGFVMDLVSK